MTSRRRCALAIVSLAIGSPVQADAQWLFAAYAGGAITHSTAVRIEQPAVNTSLQFDDTPFEGRSFQSPIYYGYRAGRIVSARRGVFLAAEFVHAKAYARLASASGHGVRRGVAVSQMPMTDVVQQLAMSHGLNFLLADVGVRRQLSGRVAMTLTAGAGAMLPHVETEIDGVVHEGYQLAGTGMQAAVGAEVRVARRLSILAEYKLTRAVMRLSVAGGEVSLSPASHHLVFGIAAVAFE